MDRHPVDERMTRLAVVVSRRQVLDAGPIHVAVDQSRRVRRTPGVVVHRMSDLPSHVQPNRAPARIRLERALLDVASEAGGRDDAVAVLADACQAGRTTASRLTASLRTRSNLRGRAFLLEVLDDVAQGAWTGISTA